MVNVFKGGKIVSSISFDLKFFITFFVITLFDDVPFHFILIHIICYEKTNYRFALWKRLVLIKTVSNIWNGWFSDRNYTRMLRSTIQTIKRDNLHSVGHFFNSLNLKNVYSYFEQFALSVASCSEKGKHDRLSNSIIICTARKEHS